MIKGVLLYSGGIDSLLAKWYLDKHNIDHFCVYYFLNCKYSREEYECVLGTVSNVVLNTSFNFGNIEKEDANIPNRNILLTTHASGAYDVNTVYICGTKSDRASDNTKEVFDLTSQIVSISLKKPVVITSPFWEQYKETLTQMYLDDNKDPKNLLNTFSCYNPIDGKECLNCNACFRKNSILHIAGITRNFHNKLIVDKYDKEFSNLTDSEQTPRSNATLKYLRALKDGKKKTSK